MITNIVNILNRGGIVILPTDTVYGIFALSDNKKAINKIYDIKKRDYKKPLQIFLPDIKSIKKYAIINKNNKKYIDKFLPGKYTLIFKIRKKNKKKFIFLKDDTIGIRVIKYRVLNEILKKLNKPLAATSANFSGDKTPCKFSEINKKIIESVDYFLKDDSVVSGKPSRVIDVSGKEIKVLR